MARKSKKETAETREALINSAISLFMQHGMARVSLDAIAAKAGVTRGAFYCHFKNKLDLIHALYHEIYSHYTTTLKADGSNDDRGNALEQLENLFIRLTLDLDTNRRHQRILTVFFLRCDYTDELAPLLDLEAQSMAQDIETFTNYFRRAVDQGLLPADTDIRLHALTTQSFLSGMCYQSLRFPEIISLKETAPALIRMFFDRYRTR